MNTDWLTEAIATAFLQDVDEVVPIQQPVPIISNHQQGISKAVRDWLEQYRVLEKRRAMHELESRATVTNLKAVTGPMNDESEDIDSARKSLRAQLALVQRKVNSVQGQLSRHKQAAVNELALSIDEADAALGESKRSHAHAFRALMTQEQQLEVELEDALNKIDLYEERRSPHGPWMQVKANIEKEEDERDASDDDDGDRDQQQRKFGKRPTRNNGCLAPEVVEFEEFVQRTGGDSGGWDKEDHEEFVKIVKSCNGDYLQAIVVCEERTIGYTHAEIVSHANWHMDYLDLLVRKRNALAKWREEKEKAKSRIIASAALLGCESAAAAKEERAVAGRTSAATNHEQQVQKEMVLKWKALKDEELRLKEAERAEAARRFEERRRIEIEERQLVNKMKIEAHKEAKARADKIKQMRSEIKAMAKASDKQLAVDPVKAWRVEERNNSFLRRRHSLIAQKEEQKVARQEIQARILDKVRVEAPSDPKRLLKGTSSHIHRVQENQEAKKEPVMSGFILKVPHLAKVNWMGNNR